ncbi:MAG: ATP-binding protein, partial [Anaerolineae bacterium]
HLTQAAVSQAAVTTVAELTSWTAVEILLPNDDVTALEVAAATENASVAVGQIIPFTGVISGEAFRLGETRSQPDGNGVNGRLAVPLRHGQKKLGVLCLIGQGEDAFDNDAVLLAESLGDAIGLALDNARLHSELRAAKETAENANQAKSEFIGVASHELKNPMAAIWGYAEVLAGGMAGELTPEQNKMIAVIKRSVQRMQTLVSDLADISRIESGYLHIELGLVSVPEVIHESAAILQTMTQGKKQQVAIAADWSLPDVWGDRNRLVQIIVNLLSNASKYTPSEGNIAISAAIDEDDSQMMRVAVADNGLGIAAAEQKKLFTKFFRSIDKKTRGTPGTGLGLNITKRLVELQHGRIWFESEYRVGTTFYFTIPLSSNKNR